MHTVQGVIPADPGAYMLRTRMFVGRLDGWLKWPRGREWLEWYAGQAECGEADRRAIGAFLATKGKAR